MSGRARSTGACVREDSGSQVQPVVEIPPSSGTGINRDEARAKLVASSATAIARPCNRRTGRSCADHRGSGCRGGSRGARDPRHNLRVTSGGHDFVATPAQIASALNTRVDGARLDLAVDQARLELALRPQLALIGAEPVDARFVVTVDNRVVVVPSRDGQGPDLVAVAAAILSNRSTVDVRLTRRHPRHDTAWAERLGITEQVSGFTTDYTAGQTRVTNIHRAADIMNNTIVEPGRVFSLNATIGARTPERGFVKAPVYYGEFTEDYGGGVSQIATTTYNAIFWGGSRSCSTNHTPSTSAATRSAVRRPSTIPCST